MTLTTSLSVLSLPHGAPRYTSPPYFPAYTTRVPSSVVPPSLGGGGLQSGWTLKSSRVTSASVKLNDTEKMLNPIVMYTRRNSDSRPFVVNRHNGLASAACRNSLTRNLPSSFGSFQ